MHTDPQAERRANLERLLRPRRVAFIGGAALAPALRACESVGFEGDVWVVSRTRTQLGARRCVPSLAHLPAAPDAAFVAVPSEATAGVIGELRSLGAGGAVCYAGGYAESGARGEKLQEELREAAGELALLGPNAIGLLNYLDGVALWREVHGGRRLEGGAALISQSGNLALELTFNARSLPLAYVVSVGNEAVLDAGDFVAALTDDPRVRAIGVFLEGVRRIDRFARACERALGEGKPIVVLKAGSSPIGASLVSTHTAALAGPDTLYDALFERLGILRARSVGEFVETLKYLSLAAAPAARRLAVLTCSGGNAALAADLAERCRLSLPELSPRQHASLREQLPERPVIANPLDYFGPAWGDRDALQRCFETVMADPGFDAVALLHGHPAAGPQALEPWEAALDAFVRASHRSARPALVIATLSELLPEPIRGKLIASGVVPLQGLEDAMAAIGAGAHYARARALRVARAARGGLRLPAATPATGRPRVLDEWQSKTVLERFGLRRPRGIACTAREAAGAAAEIGFPVVLKALAPGLGHKTEAGAVRVGLSEHDQVVAAVAQMRGLSHRFLVEAMVEDVVAELILGVRRDQGLGLALVIGSGGGLAELADDARAVLLPLERDDAAAALDTLKCARLLSGYRGAPAGDRESAIDAIMAVAAYAEARRAELRALEINPLAVLPRGRGCIVLDALIELADV